MYTKEKLELYKKAEPDLFIYEQKPVPEEILELTKKVQKLEEKNQDFEVKRDKMRQLVNDELKELLTEQGILKATKKGVREE